MIFYCAKKARKIISSIIFVLMVFGLGTGVAFASLTGNDNQSFVKFVYKNIEKEILSDKFVNIKKYFTDASNQIPNLKEILAKDIKPIEIKKVFSFNNGGAMVAGVFNTVSGTIKNFIFTRNNQSDQGESDAVSPVYSYTREEVDKIVKNKTEEIRKEILNLKSQVQSSEGNKTIINQPVSERVVEKIIETKTQVSGISQNELEERLLNLNTSLLNKISQVESNANTQTTGVYRAVSLTNRINNLSNITVSGVTGLTDSDIPDTITASNYLPLSGGAVTGNLTVDTSTLVVDSANDRVGIGTTSPTDTFSLNGAAFLANISAPSVTTNRLYSSSGNLYWNGSVIGGGIGNWTLSGSDIYYNTGNVGIGTTSPNWKLSVAGIGSFDDYVRASYFTATSTTATSTFPYLAVTTNSNLGTIVGGTWQANAIGAQYGGTGIDSSALTGIAQITSGTWSASSTLSTAYGGTGWNSVQSNSILLGNGSGRLATTTSGTDGQVLALVNGTPTWQSTTTLSTISGTLGVSQGGTGQDFSASSGLVNFYSGTASAIATSSLGLLTTNVAEGSNQYWTTDRFDTRLAATTTLPNLTTLLGLTNASTTLLTVSSNAYFPGSGIWDSSGSVGIGTTSPNWKLSVAGAGSFDDYVRASYFTATSTTATSTFPYLAVTTNSNLGTIVGGTWQANAIGAQYGGTGQNFSASSGLVNFYSGTASAIATSSLGLLTTNVAEGSNQYWTTDRFDTRLAATTTLPNLTTLLGLTNATTTNITSTNSWLGNILSGTWNGTAIGDAYLTKSGDWTGTLDTYEASSLLARANHTGTQDVSTLSNYDWTFSNNYGAINLTASSTKPIWAQGGINASSTSNFVYASTTALTVSGNSYLGTVSSGTWNGTAIGAQYGGTGQNFSASSGLVNFYSGAASTIATSSLGLLTTDVTEGTNQYWTNDRFDTRLSSTTTLPNLTTLLGLTNASTTLLTVSSNAYFPGSGIWDSSGNVGIGTTSPNWKLSVAGIGSFDDYVRASYFTATSTTATSTIAGVFSVGSTTPAANALFSVGTSSPLFFIDKQTGNIGVGTLGGSARRFEVLDVANPQLRLSQDSTTYTDFTVAPSTGDLTLSLYPSGSADDIILTMPGGSTGANLWVCEGTACPSANLTGGGNIFVEGGITYATSTTPKTRRSIILTSAGSIVPTASGAAKTQVDGTNHSYYVLDFDADSDEAAYWQWTMPDSYDDGVIDVTYYWEAGATSGDTIWCFQSIGLASNNSEDIDTALGAAVCETDTAQGNANDLASITETNATSNFVAGDYVAFKVFRDADAGGDTMTGDARLVKVKIEYGVDQESD